MRRLYLGIAGFSLISSCFAAGNSLNPKLDLFFGEAIYYARQGDYFDAIARLDSELGQFYRLDEPNLDPFHLQVNYAEFSVGDFELLYRMDKRAGRAIKTVLDGNVTETVRNEAAFRLARIFLNKNDPVNALHTIERVHGKVPDSIKYEEPYLHAQIDMANGKFSDSIKLLSGLRDVEGLEGFASYNLGLSLLQDGKEKEGILELDRTGQIKSDDDATQAIKDKANLALGYRLLEAKQPQLAKRYLDRVRLKGPFSNKALLGSGWADVALGRYDRALVPWTILFKRNVTDKPVQEAMMGVPYAYSKLHLYGKAALLYGSALDSFSKETAKLDASIKSIREGKFLEALVREELKQDKNWVVKLRSLPDAPETYYLLDLMASNDFQESLKNYLDLEELRKHLVKWDVDIDAYEDMIALRRKYYEPLLPEIDKQFRVLDSQMKLRLEQRQHLDARLHAMLVAPRPDFLATADERVLLQTVSRLEKELKNRNDPEAEKLRARIDRLKGLVRWQIVTQYDRRLTDAYKHLRELDGDVERLTKVYKGFVRTRQAATQSYEGYDDEIRQLRNHVRDSQERVKTLMARQGHMLEVMAVNELDARRKRLEEYQVQARFAMAEAYDRATTGQNGESGTK